MNQLSAETSPYLLQHRHNPVHWSAWNARAWQRAREENKLVLVSVGYSACHWCHVMEREVFEDNACAAAMNRSFVCIKVDREERPDVDMLYMDALHLMGQRGGWPLNVFTLPDGRAVFGGTYFPKNQWLNILDNLQSLYRDEPGRMLEYAGRLFEGLHARAGDTQAQQPPAALETGHLNALVNHWKQWWDTRYGGSTGAPKFPMPCNWNFLLNYALISADADARQMVTHTLTRMALGGLFDQAGGGFARYSVDDHWHVPHFEKMLYDNAQLVEVYSRAAMREPRPLFRQVVNATLEWLLREMHADEGLYYAALDADSEGVEGKYYVWTEDELASFLTEEELAVMQSYFGIGNASHWEHGLHVLCASVPPDEFRLDGLTQGESEALIARLRIKLERRRASRTRPGTDVKCITSWNAMMLRALVAAATTWEQEKWLDEAEKLASAMLRLFYDAQGRLMHVRTSGATHTPAFLDDYAQFADALLALHEATAAEHWLREARALIDAALARFADDESPLLWYSQAEDTLLISRKKDIQDNVTPASNSVMCGLLCRLERHWPGSGYGERGRAMLEAVARQIDHASAYANWLNAYALVLNPGEEIVITGPEAPAWKSAIASRVKPGTLVMASTTSRSLPLFEGRFGQQTTAYVCSGHSCRPPVFSLQALEDFIRS